MRDDLLKRHQIGHRADRYRAVRANGVPRRFHSENRLGRSSHVEDIGLGLFVGNQEVDGPDQAGCHGSQNLACDEPKHEWLQSIVESAAAVLHHHELDQPAHDKGEGEEGDVGRTPHHKNERMNRPPRELETLMVV